MPLSRVQVFQMENETAYGTPPAMDATNSQIVFDASVTEEDESYSRAVMEAYGRPMRGDYHGRRRLKFSFSQELRGHPDDYAAAKYPAFHAPMQACGMSGTYAGGANTWTYQHPVNGGYAGTAPPAVAGYLWQNNLMWTMRGARGNCVLQFRQGQSALAKFNLTSLFTTPTVNVLTAPDYSTGTAGWKDMAPPRVENIGFHPLGAAPSQGEFGHIRSLEIDFRSNVVARESPLCSSGNEGIGEVSVLGFGTNDDPGIGMSFEVEQPLTAAGLTESSWWNAWELQTLMRAIGGATYTITLGTVSGNTFVWTIGGLVVKKISQIDMGGRWGAKVEGRLLGTAASTTEDSLILVAS